MADKKKPLLVEIHNTTCPAWLLNITFLKKLEPGCRIAAGYEEKA
jgi:hypothetical protein